MRFFFSKKSEVGFSLAELLVVIVIIGILAAIAVPVFLHQRQQAWRAESRSDLNGIRTQVMDQLIDNRSLTIPETYITALKQAGVWESVELAPSGVVSGKTYLFCATKDTFALGSFNGTAGASDQIFVVTSEEGSIRKATIEPAGPSLINRFCNFNLPGWTYSAWAHDMKLANPN